MARPEKTDKYFPVLGSIAEEDETAGNKKETEDIVEITPELSEDEDIDPDDAKKASSQPGWENEDQAEDLNNDELGIGFTLKKKKEAAISTALEPMFTPMLKVTKKYLDLSLACNTVIIATFLHPEWRMMLFTMRLKTHFARITKLIQKTFDDRQSYLKSIQPESTPPKTTQSDLNATPTDLETDGDDFNYYPTTSTTIEINTELKRYNKGDFPMAKKGDVLGRWKLRAKHQVSKSLQ
ncbi:hypothetical protein PtA15_6A413 [Puccinia triticina]|uniref:Uncharacterized protein n=1 Tax=Puccinia triticina TaxID=208348 RepID=A0ABY7CKN3_9BASI|nr:uncharacterized protein PtA15_6A413 [Puccinia triticina]WAQ85784.1 hypothetical protein PtA15_6A413 [Puccinia triticina]